MLLRVQDVVLGHKAIKLPVFVHGQNVFGRARVLENTAGPNKVMRVTDLTHACEWHQVCKKPAVQTKGDQVVTVDLNFPGVAMLL